MKEREIREFVRDAAYMKDDIWEEGEIVKTFGHDPATYANIDNPQHYATVQFAGNPETNNKNVVLKDHYTEARTEINDALRAVKANVEGKFARDGAYQREDLWNAPVEGEGVTRTVRGKREDGKTIESHEGSRVYGEKSDFQFEHDAGYMQTDILAVDEAPAEAVTPADEAPATPAEAPECPAEETPESDCAPGTLGNGLAAADAAAEKIDQIIAPVGGND